MGKGMGKGGEEKVKDDTQVNWKPRWYLGQER